MATDLLQMLALKFKAFATNYCNFNIIPCYIDMSIALHGLVKRLATPSSPYGAQIKIPIYIGMTKTLLK